MGKQVRTGRNQARVDDVCKTTSAFSTLGSSTAMLTMVFSVKTLTKSVVVARLDNQHTTKAGQGIWKCGLPAGFIDVDQMSLESILWKRKFVKFYQHKRDVSRIHSHRDLNSLSLSAASATL